MQNKYDQIISEFVKQTTLKRIRIKTDPRATDNFAQADGYEGFVLEEDDLGNIVAFIPDIEDNNIMDIPLGNYTPCDGYEGAEENPELELLKKHVLSNLIDSGDFDDDDPEIENVLVLTNINQLHDHLNQKGIEDEKLLEILCIQTE